MPQPTFGDVHISAALTDLSVAYIQNTDHFIADKVFPIVPVRHQADKYFVWTKGDWFRDEAQKRADATESAGGGFTLSQLSYSADVWAFHKDVGDQTRRNQDPAIDIDTATVEFVTHRLLIRRDRDFVASFMGTGLWGTDVTGVASSPSTGQTIQWSQESTSDPFTDLSNGQLAILQNTGQEANTLVLGYPVYLALRKHPLVIDRIKFVMKAEARAITPELMAAAFDIDRVIVSKAVYNSAIEGSTANAMGFIMGNNALLCHTPSSPGLLVPAAGYTFVWEGFTGLNSMGVQVSQIPMPWKGKNTVRTEAEMAWDTNIVGADLGYYFSAIA